MDFNPGLEFGREAILYGQLKRWCEANPVQGGSRPALALPAPSTFQTDSCDVSVSTAPASAASASRPVRRLYLGYLNEWKKSSGVSTIDDLVFKARRLFPLPPHDTHTIQLTTCGRRQCIVESDEALHELDDQEELKVTCHPIQVADGSASPSPSRESDSDSGDSAVVDRARKSLFGQAFAKLVPERYAAIPVEK